MIKRPKPEKEDLERICRLYRSTKNATEALGISHHTFFAACKTFGIDVPWKKK